MALRKVSGTVSTPLKSQLCSFLLIPFPIERGEDTAELSSLHSEFIFELRISSPEPNDSATF